MPVLRDAARFHPILGAAVIAVGLPLSTQAATLESVYLISSQSDPTNVSSPPFEVVGTTVYELSLTGTLATGYSLLGGELRFDVDQALTYKSHNGTINSGEAGGTPQQLTLTPKWAPGTTWESSMMVVPMRY